MKFSFLFTFPCFLFPVVILAQHTNVVIGTSIGYGLPSEPSVAMNPSNPQEIMIGAMPYFYFKSQNGGATWEEGILESQWGVQADPCLLADPSGGFYYLHLPNVIERAVCHHTGDIAEPWELESSIAFDGSHDVDKEWAAFDPVTGKLYVSWTYFDEWGSTNPDDSSCIYMSRSDDQGQMWTDPVRVSDKKGNASGGNNSVHGSYITTGPAGEVYITWWSPEGLMFDRSTDTGITWLDNDINITGQQIYWIYTIPGVNMGVTFPVIACDRSGGPHHGNIYICWADKRYGGTNTDVFIVKSCDGGDTWSDPIRVNDDLSITHQYFPYIAVDQVTGKLWAVFFDRRNYTNTNTDVYMAVSSDGGESFLNFRISESPFIPFGSVFYGHYIGLAVHDGHVLPVWTRMDNGESTLMGALVDPLVVGIEHSSLQPFAVLENAPNPFTENLFVSFRLRKSAHVSLNISDITGRWTVNLIRDKWYTAGKYVEKLDADSLGLEPGTYLISLTTGMEVITRKVILIG